MATRKSILSEILQEQLSPRVLRDELTRQLMISTEEDWRGFIEPLENSDSPDLQRSARGLAFCREKALELQAASPDVGLDVPAAPNIRYLDDESQG